MKKKIKDLTFEELKNICKKQQENCMGCLMFELDYICSEIPENFTDKQLNTEIEVEEDE